MTAKVFVTHQLPGDRIHELAKCCQLNVWMGPGLLSSAGLRTELRGAQGLLCMLTDRIDKSLLDSLPDLNFVSSMSVGVDHIELLFVEQSTNAAQFVTWPAM